MVKKLSYAVFRVQGIKTTGDLRGIGKHNLERVSATNDDIDASRFEENIHLIQPPESKSYLKKFFEVVEPMKLEHEEKMKSERKDRVRSFESKINSSKSDVACEFLFTSGEEFFKDMSKEEIKTWAETSLDFVKKEIGIPEEQILHAVVHMDEKTPHLHIVAVPLVQKYDGRAKKETWQLNRKHFIRTKEDMAKLQDSYHGHMQSHGYDLERGIKGSKNRHLSVERFKAQENLKSLEEQQKALEGVVEDLGFQKEMLDMDIQELVEAVDVSVKVESIPVEKAGLFDRRSVRMASEDFERIKTLAKASEGLKTKEKALKTQIEGLNDQNIVLKNANEQLKKEKQKLVMVAMNLEKENKKMAEERDEYKRLANYYKRVLEEVKRLSEHYLKVDLNKMQGFLGKVRMLTVGKVFGEKFVDEKLVDGFVPENERKGALEYIAFFKDKLKKRDVELARGEKEEPKEAEKVQDEMQPPVEQNEKTIKANDDFEMDR